MALYPVHSAWTRYGKKKPVDHRDTRGERATEVQLLDMHGKTLLANFGDTVLVHSSSLGASARQEGTIDGFTEHRVRMLLEEGIRNFA